LRASSVTFDDQRSVEHAHLAGELVLTGLTRQELDEGLGILDDVLALADEHT